MKNKILFVFLVFIYLVGLILPRNVYAEEDIVENLVDSMTVEEKIAQILEKIINRNIALELNTCVPGGDYDASFLYNSRILTLYKGIGGKMVTLGSDAHVKESIARNFNEGVALLKKHGFDSVYYF